MRLKLEDSQQSLSVRELNEFQEIFRAQLPAAFRQFYLKHNGGDLSDSNDDNDFFWAVLHL
ncbi:MULTISPECIES: SMI1/KNR4 family protein [Pseudomonas]|jgi:hypothetical protein|uniref:SMI1/KNR4 family protein n=1 Tax=Pseudomonas TaxID=286 RepID=UPI0012591679|nr:MULTISPECIES: SMI1/KNR4 family protein [Pseudomonas]VVO12410.1 hypothetical protein PS834_03554 [Pseudomonas fluorescens]